jgi:neutral ceramidase
MQFYSFPLPNGTQVQTCPAALGYGFAGGTTDGPGAFDFIQGDNSSTPQNPFWAAVSGLLTTPTAAQVSCQGAKPILLDVGQMSAPYSWSPNIIDVQSFRVGQLIMIISPSEATTMTGRRWKAAVSAAAVSKGITSSTPKVVLGGPANTYAHYCATPEEYAIQRYEGASTLYGPWQSYAYMHLSEKYIGYLAAGNYSQPAQGTLPPNNAKSSLSFIEGVAWDSPWIGYSFGSVLSQPSASYKIGAVINATFVAADPRNNLRLEDTYAAVQQLVSGAWKTVRDDSDWFLVLTWTRDNSLTGSSHVVISWETESYATAGTYRIVYNGDSRNLFGTITSFTGYSGNFTLS